MNREIKFRAWDKNKKLFIPTDVWAICQTNFNAFGIMLKDWENYKEGEYFYNNSQELSQYTGLKDKNGVEIYEGDIVLHQMSEFHCEIIYKKSIAQFMAKELFGKRKVWQISIKKDILVIGNIYENPELLNK